LEARLSMRIDAARSPQLGATRTRIGFLLGLTGHERLARNALPDVSLLEGALDQTILQGVEADEDGDATGAQHLGSRFQERGELVELPVDGQAQGLERARR